VTAEKTRGDALSKRFEEALKQAHQEPSPSRRETSTSTELHRNRRPFLRPR
jgi:hypothetical protein